MEPKAGCRVFLCVSMTMMVFGRPSTPKDDFTALDQAITEIYRQVVNNIVSKVFGKTASPAELIKIVHQTEEHHLPFVLSNIREILVHQTLDNMTRHKLYKVIHEIIDKTDLEKILGEALHKYRRDDDDMDMPNMIDVTFGGFGKK